METSSAPSRPADKLLLTRLTAKLAAAYLHNSNVPVNSVSGLIDSIYRTLAGLTEPRREPVADKPVPAVAVSRSVRSDHIVCLEDGKKLKMLKRHLWTHYRMTPEDYRKKWDLPADYPMVAPDYAKQRSMLAKKIGLGRPRREGDAVGDEVEAA